MQKDMQKDILTSIRILPKDLAQKIAAGEVVERPGSVIKELVENSLDAGATRIRVEIEDGGRKGIVISDDGHGITAVELPIALERHATSKITELDDLWKLRTMGFRGEALPSIAAVSRFTIESRRQGEPNGRKLYLEGGTLIQDGVVDATSSLNTTPTGTRIAVQDLFYNVPARLKFLKSKSSEASFIRELLERVALCNPGVAFTLHSDGRKLLQLEAATTAGRVGQVLEAEPANIETLETQFEDITVRGWLDRDSRAPNSRHVYLSVNGRMVRDKLLQQAVLVALRPRMMEGEYPRIFLAVEVPPGDVDVNVHPAKSEVRFRRARDVFQVVHGALDQLARTPAKPFYSAPLPEAEAQTPVQDRAPTSAPPSRSEPELTPALFANDRVAYKTKDYVALSIGGLMAGFETSAEPETKAHPEEAEYTAPVTQRPGFSSLQYIGQLKNTYLLFQDADGLVLIDQHAAHERINYEKIKAEFLKTGLRAQPLLVSAVVKCKPDDVALALEHADAFTRLGFEFEAFGDNCLLVRAAPEGMRPDRASELFRTLLEELRGSEAVELLAADPSRLSAKVERVLATSACHSSVRAGQALSLTEARELAQMMDYTESSLNCPHGRPASIRLTYSQIEGLFKR